MYNVKHVELIKTY